MKDDQIFTGIISRYNSERCFGFIEDNNKNSFFFHLKNTEQILLKNQGIKIKKYKFCPGDEVQFKLILSKKYPNNFEAYNVKYIQNEQRNILIQEANENNILNGHIKLGDNEKLFVKHMSTGIHLPLLISAWETSHDEIYTNRINKLVSFKLNQTQKIDKLFAILTDIKLCDEYYEIQKAIENNTQIQVKITGKNSYGFFAKVLDNLIDGFIRLPKKNDKNNNSNYERLNINDIITVKILRINKEKSVLLSIDLD